MSSNKQPNSFLFAAVMCIICSILLTAAAVGLKDRQKRNVQMDQQKNILRALSLYEEGLDVADTFKNKVKVFYLDKSGSLTPDKSEDAKPVYILGSKNSIQKYALPFKAFGLWSWIHGYVGLEGDGKTIVGFTVYQHGETPGLGGEVEKEWFQSQFKGKQIVDEKNEFVSIGVVKGKVSEKIPASNQINYVDGMSGATLTGKGLEKHLKTSLGVYESFSKKLRQGL